ncbi:glycosyltransferase [Kocuria palustris]
MIGLYAHHQGAGHLTRCRALARALAPHEEAVILSSHPEADVVLPMDAPADERGVTAHGALHWAPQGHDGYTERMAMIAAWVRDHRPSVVHVDLSVEVTALVRLLGVPTTVQALPGIRDDAPHELSFRLADRIVAAWPDWVALPAHLAPSAERVHRVGGISRFEGRALCAVRGRDAAILLGRGGQDGSPAYWHEVARIASAHLGGRCRLLGLDEWVEDPFEVLSEAGVVITAAGQNSVADAAAAGAPMIVLAQQRPFAEQETTARILADAGLAVVPEAPGLPAPGEWPQLIDRALLLGSPQDRRRAWQVDGAASRAAETVLGAAGHGRGGS